MLISSLAGAQRARMQPLWHLRQLLPHAAAAHPFSQQHSSSGSGNSRQDGSQRTAAAPNTPSAAAATSSSSSSQRLRQRFQPRPAAAFNDGASAAAAAATLAAAHASATVTAAPVPSSTPSSSSFAPPSASSVHRSKQSAADQAAAHEARLLQELCFSLHDDKQRDKRWPEQEDLAVADDAFDFVQQGQEQQQRWRGGRSRRQHSSDRHSHRDVWTNSYERPPPLRDEPLDEFAGADAAGAHEGGLSVSSSEETQAAALQQLERELALVEQNNSGGSKIHGTHNSGASGASLHAMQLRRLASAARQVMQVVSRQSVQIASLQAALQQSEDTVRVLARQFTPQHVNRELQAAGKAPRSSAQERARAAAEAAAMERALSALTEPMRARVLAALQAAGYGPTTAPWLLPFSCLRRLLLSSARDCTPQQVEQVVAFVSAVQAARPADLSVYTVVNEEDGTSRNPVAEALAERDRHMRQNDGDGEGQGGVLTSLIIERMFVLLVWQQAARQLTRSFWQISLVLLFQAMRLIGPAATPSLSSLSSSSSWRPSAFVYDVLLHATLQTQQHRQEMDVAAQAVEHALRRSVLAATDGGGMAEGSLRVGATVPSAAAVTNAPAPAFIEHALWQWSDSAYAVPITPAQALQILFACLPSLQPAHALLFWQHCVEVRAVSQQLAQALGTFMAGHLIKLVNLRDSTHRTPMASASAAAPSSRVVRRPTELDDAIHTTASVLVTLLSDWAALELEQRDVHAHAHPDAFFAEGLLSSNSSSMALERWTDPQGHTHWLDARSALVRQVVATAGRADEAAAAAGKNKGVAAGSAPPDEDNDNVHIPDLDDFKPSGAAWTGWTLMRRNRFSAQQMSAGMASAPPQHSFSVALREHLFPLPPGTPQSVSFSFFSGLVASSSSSESDAQQQHQQLSSATAQIDSALRAVHEDIAAAGLEQPASASPHADPFWGASRASSSHSSGSGEDGGSRSVAQRRSAAKARLAQHIQRKFMRTASAAEDMRVDSLPLPSAYPLLHRQ